MRYIIILITLISNTCFSQSKILNSVKNDSSTSKIEIRNPNEGNTLKRQESNISEKEKEYYEGRYNPDTFSEESHKELKKTIFWNEIKVITFYSILLLLIITLLFMYNKNKAIVKAQFIDKLNVGNYRISLIFSIAVFVIVFICCSIYKMFNYHFMMYDILNIPFMVIRPIVLSALAFIIYWTIVFIVKWVKNGYSLDEN